MPSLHFTALNLQNFPQTKANQSLHKHLSLPNSIANRHKHTLTARGLGRKSRANDSKLDLEMRMRIEIKIKQMDTDLARVVVLE